MNTVCGSDHDDLYCIYWMMRSGLRIYLVCIRLQVEHCAVRLILSLNHGVDRGVELLASLEERQGDDEEVFEGDTSCLLDELSGGRGGSTRGDQVAVVSLPYLSLSTASATSTTSPSSSPDPQQRCPSVVPRHQDLRSEDQT